MTPVSAAPVSTERAASLSNGRRFYIVRQKSRRSLFPGCEVDVAPELRAEARHFLSEIPVFGALPERPMEKLLELIEVRSLAPGEIVCAEGDPGREMFVIHAGIVDVTKRSRSGDSACLASLGAGDCFGEMSLIDVQPRSATVVTRRDTELYVLSNAAFFTLYQYDLEGYTLLVMNICRELSRRLRSANSVIASQLIGL